MSPWVSISLVWTGRRYQRINSILTLRPLITTKTQEKERAQEKGQQKHFKYDCFRQPISSCMAADKSTPPPPPSPPPRLGLNSSPFWGCKKTSKHIFIKIQRCRGVIDSIINWLIFMAGIGTSNTMTSIISPLKLRSLYSPLPASDTLNRFSREVFFFSRSFFFFFLIRCFFSASPESGGTDSSPAQYVGQKEWDDASGTAFVSLRTSSDSAEFRRRPQK